MLKKKASANPRRHAVSATLRRCAAAPFTRVTRQCCDLRMNTRVDTDLRRVTRGRGP